MSFYDHEQELVATVARFIADGLADGDRAVVVLTEPHRLGVEAAMRSLGVDADVQHDRQRYVPLDAEMTLGAFLRDGSPDPDRFRATIGRFISDARDDGSPVRFFGEMVNVLWEDGNVTGALELEVLWNDLIADEGFELLCAYPTLHLDSSRLADLHQVCAHHSRVLPPPSYTGTPDSPESSRPGLPSRVFLPVPESIGAVRRFVDETLRAWREDHLAGDGTLIASELATNAVLHARSPFRVSIDRGVGVVCVSVQDTSAGEATQRDAQQDAADGRGMAIVEALARRWGCDSLPSGKVIWAELGPTA
ncbi:MEDS domain-containing protein [Nocardioides sp. GCM10027113]|uniref:MEDS domain-containing protein n=1 Tax=unclassified Nocardioides TaxID=2615069 RepID=UPI003610A754